MSEPKPPMNQTLRAISGRSVLTLLALFLSPLTILSLQAGPTKGSGASSFPQIELPGISRGQNAASQLGAQLPQVAQAYGLNAQDLLSLLLNDSTLAVDRGGRLHYTDPKPQGVGVVNSSVPLASGIPLSDTFKLHSRAGAKRIIYLDFDGQDRKSVV